MGQEATRELILTALQSGDDQVRAERLAQAPLQVWQEVPALARQHGIAPLLYWQLRSNKAQVPPSVLHALRIDYLQSANTNALLFERVAHLLDQFRKHDIPVIVLKGAYLAPVIYPTIAVRPMNDIDLLIRERDLDRATELVQALGLARLQELDEPTEEICHLAFHSDEEKVHLEIHWNLVPDSFGVHLDVEGLWQRAQPVKIAGVPTLALAGPDQLLHLSLHLALHSLGLGLRALCDIAWTIQTQAAQLDWTSLQRNARAWGITRCVYVALSLARELLNAPVPEELLTELKPKEFETAYMAMAREHIFARVETSDQALPSSTTLVDIWAAKTLAGKVQRLSKSFFPSRRLLAMMFPVRHDSPRIWLYYPARWWQLLQRYWQLAWSLARGDPEILSRAQRQKQVNALRDWMLLS